MTLLAAAAAFWTTTLEGAAALALLADSLCLDFPVLAALPEPEPDALEGVVDAAGAVGRAAAVDR